MNVLMNLSRLCLRALLDHFAKTKYARQACKLYPLRERCCWCYVTATSSIGQRALALLAALPNSTPCADWLRSIIGPHRPRPVHGPATIWVVS